LTWSLMCPMSRSRSRRNPECRFGGELVPDKTLKAWKPSNPLGYRAKIERRAALQPRIRLVAKAADSAIAERQVEPFPENKRLKGLLCRTVQIAKRHRDIAFMDDKDGLAPLSIIITTLASRTYEFCVRSFEYDHELDLIVDLLERMPDALEQRVIGTRVEWYLWNQTTADENFCEKWNKHPERAVAFFEWHAKLVSDVKLLAAAQGFDVLRRLLGNVVGATPANAVMDSLTEQVSVARYAGRLSVTRPAGLMVGSAAMATPVRANTFYGDRP
jgi:hypothetical protein